MQRRIAEKTFYIKQGDRSPALPIQVTSESTNLPLDLTGASVKFNLRQETETDPKVEEATCTIVDALNGKFEYRWATGDTDTVGTYKGEFIITLSNGTQTTIPANGYIIVEVLKRLN